MTKEYILNLLRENKEDMVKKYGVKKIGLFGSYATGKDTSDSDIDIFVELEENRFRKVAGLWVYLDELYKKQVDLFREHKNNKGAIYEHIKKETIFI